MATPTPTPTPALGFEADLAPRFNGDGLLRSNDVEVARMLIAGINVGGGSNEFQRADVAPYDTRGDGRLDATDFQLVKNYVAVLVPPQTGGGPTDPLPFPPGLSEESEANAGSRIIRIVGDYSCSNWNPFAEPFGVPPLGGLVAGKEASLSWNCERPPVLLFGRLGRQR